jgi:hypothetical protein
MSRRENCDLLTIKKLTAKMANKQRMKRDKNVPHGVFFDREYSLLTLCYGMGLAVSGDVRSINRHKYLRGDDLQLENILNVGVTDKGFIRFAGEKAEGRKR